MDRIPAWVRWTLPFVVVALCTVVNIGFQPLIGNRAPFLPYLIGLVVCALYGGIVVGVFALALSVPAVSWFWLEPQHQLALASDADRVAMMGFVAAGLMLIYIAHKARVGIIDRERLATALAEGQQRLQNAVSVAELAVYDWAPATGELRWDPRLKAMWGLPPDAHVDIGIHDAAIHPDDRERVEAAKRRCVDPAGDGVFDLEFRVIGYDGVERWIAGRGQVYFDNRKPVRYVGVARETTMRHRREEALRRSAARDRLLSDVSEATRALADPAGITIAALRVLREYLGADRCAHTDIEADEDHFEFAGAACADDVPSIHGRYAISAFGSECRQLLRAGRPFVLDDWTAQLPAGADRTVYETTGMRAFIAVPLLKNGRLVAGTGAEMRTPREWRADEVDAVRQVSERIWEAIERARTARALRDSEQRFRVAQETSPLGFTIMRAVRADDGRVVDFEWLYANPAAGRILKRDAASLPGRRMIDVLPATRRPDGLFDAYVRVLETGEAHNIEIGYRAERFDGVFLNACSRLDDGVAAWFMDITERKRAEEALAGTALSLARERERLAIALRTGQMGVYEWHLGANELWWSPEIFPVYGVEPATFRPTVEAFGALVHPDDRDELWRKTDESIARRDVFEHEYRILRPDGQVRWIANRSQVGFDATGEVERITGVAVDVTERRRAEELLQEADRRKDEFLATLAHELRNPLAPIVNAVELLELRMPPDPALDATRDVIRRQVAHMVRLVDDLLDVSRITRNKLMLRPTSVTVASVIAQAVESVKPQIERARQRLAVRVPPPAARVVADPVRLVQVLTNLLANASKYSFANTEIAVSTEELESDVAIVVQDEGIGIAPDHLPKLFEMFSQASPALERSQGGLGIGLWLSRRLVELQGGSIRASSDGPNKGSRFEVRLPLEQAAEPARAAAPNARPDGAGRKVLVVDDNVDGATTLATLLATTGNDVITAFDGVEAIRSLERFEPDVVLLDIGLPKMNGYDVCRELRRRYGHRVAIIAMTGWGQEDDRRRTAEAGFDRHLVKPVDFELLVDLLKTETAH